MLSGTITCPQPARRAQPVGQGKLEWKQKMAATHPKTETQPTTEDAILSVAEIERRYHDEWVLLEITRDHKHHQRVKGQLLAHSPNRYDLDEPYRRLRAKRPQAHTFEFYTGQLVRDDVVVIL